MLNFTFLPFLLPCPELLPSTVSYSICLCALDHWSIFFVWFKSPTSSCVSSLKTYPWSGDADGNIDRHRLPRWLSSKESTHQCRRHWFDPYVRKIPWRRKWQSTPVFLPEKPHGQRSMHGHSPWGLQRIGHDCAHRHRQKPV